MARKKDQPAKPTETKTKSKSAKTVFPSVGNKDAKVYPFTKTVPKDFDFKVHKPLKKRDFASDHLFYEFRALEMDNKAVTFRKQAEEAKTLGSSQDRGRAKRLVKMTEKMDELKQQLEAQGVDVKALLATASKDE